MMRNLSMVLLVVAGSSAWAAESPCAEGLRKLHAEYFQRFETLQKQESSLRLGGYAVGAGGLACLWKTRSIVLCSGMLGTILVGSQGYRYRVLSQIHELENAYKIYELYYHATRQDFGDDSMQKLFSEAEVSLARQEGVSNDIVKLVESGELCESGAKPAKTYEEVVGWLSSRVPRS